MNILLKNKLLACIIIIMFVSAGYPFAADVTVQEGSMHLDNTLYVWGISNHHMDTLYLSAEHAELYNTEINGDLLINNGDIAVDGGIAIGEQFYLGLASGDGALYSNSGILLLGGSIGIVDYDCAYFTTDIQITGKVTSSGGYDPPYVLYDQQSRKEVIDRIKKEVPPDKQNGAALFFNKETKRLETYVASEGKFYDLEGNIIYELAQVVEPTIKYETAYRFDSTTGQTLPILRPVQEKFHIKKGYKLDDKTGNFINSNTKQVASREESLEIYASSEGKVYDLQHNFVRNIEKKQSSDIAAAGNNNSDAQINNAQNNAEMQDKIIKPASLNK
ncbi:MAG: hypothetical protein JXA96_16905 [Sedimentisphaerales bacterium]|nr:hypothetical protein [Sedimentisphaerales bacterium]